MSEIGREAANKGHALLCFHPSRDAVRTRPQGVPTKITVFPDGRTVEEREKRRSRSRRACQVATTKSLIELFLAGQASAADRHHALESQAQASAGSRGRRPIWAVA